MSAFYKSNTDSFVTPEKVKLSIIWIAQTQDNKGSDKAKEALATIKAGTSFAEVAKQYSEDGTAEDGGAIDEWFSRQATNRQAVREACFQEIDENWNPHKQLQIIKKVIYE